MAFDFAQARDLFEHCLTLDPVARRAALAQDTVPPALRARVEAMLRADAQLSPLLDGGVAEALAAWEPLSSPEPAPPGSRDFEILRELGRGGMGAVYLARQREPERLVALKRLGVGPSAAMLERFRLEADALARLQHPGIAAIHGVGRDDAGEPFLVMEYVDGTPLAEHVATLPRPARLRLLADLADAVEHAHSRGVIHRDLKPGNVLVDVEGRPKVLDFGIARLARDDDAARALTQDGMLLGTPAYMSPEQAAGAPAGPAADVWALGAIGYEWLAGRLPVPVTGLSPLAALRAIANEPVTPLGRIAPALRGDLDAVFATALARDPAARYRSAAAFADDLRRVLAHEPVRARRPSGLRRLALYARRKPALAGSLALLALALAAGAAVATFFALGERAERLRAESALAQARAERDRADSTLRFLAALLAEASPARSGRPDTAVRDILDRALPRVQELPDAAQASLLLVLADALSGFGPNAGITPLYQRAVELSRGHAGEREARAAQVRYGSHLLDLGSVVEARAHLRAALQGPDAALLPPVERRRAMAQLGRAEAQLGNEAATRVLRDALRNDPAPPAADGEVPPELLIAYEELRLFQDFGDGDQLVATWRDVMPRATAALGADHPFVLALGRFEAAVHFHQRDDAGALAAAERNVARHRAVLGPDHAETLRARAQLGAALADQGRLAEAIETLQHAREDAAAALPDSSALHLELFALQALPRYMLREGAPILAQGPALHDLFCSDQGARHEHCGLAAMALALVHADGDAVDASAQWLARAEAFFHRRLGPDHPLLVTAYSMLAQQHARRGRIEEATRLTDAAAAMLGRRNDIAPRRYANPRMLLTQAYVRVGRPDLAMPLARQVYEVDAPAGYLVAAQAARTYAGVLDASGRRDEALRVMDAAWAAEQRAAVPQLQDRTDMARTFVALWADRDRETWLKWARVLRDLRAAGGGVPPTDRASIEALAALEKAGR